MLLLLTLIGLLTAAPIPVATDVMAEEEPDTFYYRIKHRVENEILTETAALSSQWFALGTYYDQPLNTTIKRADGSKETVVFDVDHQHVDYALKGLQQHMCGTEPASEEEHQNEYIMCNNAQKRLKELSKRVSWIQRLGRDLQVIASGYETGVVSYPGMPIDVVPRMSSITHLWRATNDAAIHPIIEQQTRGLPWPRDEKDDIEALMQEAIDTAHDSLIRTWTDENDEEKTDETDLAAAMWRYRHGIQYVRDHSTEADCTEDPAAVDIHRYRLEQRFCALEEALLAIREAVQTIDINPPKKKDEHLIFPSYIDKERNIMIWVREDDVGMRWYIPEEPIHVSLFSEEFVDCMEAETPPKECVDAFPDGIVRGGTYPQKITEEDIADGRFKDMVDREDGMIVPEPRDGKGICSHPFAQRGYLCRMLEYEACNLTEEEEKELQDGGREGLVVSRCQPERFRDDVARRSSGPDICGIGGWRGSEEPSVHDSPGRDLGMTPNECSACAIDIICAEECDGQTTLAKTRPAKRKGVVEICIPNAIGDTPVVEYAIAHEMVHAQQICNEGLIQTYERAGLLLDEDDPDQKEEKIAACCAFEREAYFTQCKFMALDGVLDRAGLSIDQCASSLSNLSCVHLDDNPFDEDYVCTNDNEDPEAVRERINEAGQELAEDLDLVSGCPAIVNDMPARLQAFKDSLPLVCSPGCISQYENTIGNNFCFIGQCIEQTHEFGRSIAGRTPFTSLDQKYPWDSCELPDPQFGRLGVPPAIMSPHFPTYNPEGLVHMLDTTLCQINGLPARTPPVICAFNPLKRLHLLSQHALENAGSVRLQTAEYATTGIGIANAATGIGSRIVTDLFTLYLQSSSKQLTDLLVLTKTMLDELDHVSFPATMCPRFAEAGLCQQLR